MLHKVLGAAGPAPLQSLSRLEWPRKSCSGGGCRSFNDSNLFPRDFTHLSPVKTRGTPNLRESASITLETCRRLGPLLQWRGWAEGMHHSTLLHPSSRHPEAAPQGSKSAYFHIKFPELCSEVCHKGPLCVPRVCPLCELTGRALPRPLSLCSITPKQLVSRVGASVTTRWYGIPEKDPTCQSAPWQTQSDPSCCCIPAAVCEQLRETWDRVRLGEVGDQRQ